MEILITSVLAFASTNIDDIFILTLFYGSKQFRKGEIMAGQFMGISTLIAVSLIGSLLGLLIDQSYIGLLGLVPIYLGIKGIWGLVKSKDEKDENVPVDKIHRKSNVLAVAGVTLANGGDNIGIYVPLFATLTWTNKMAMVTVFLVMTFLWCLTANYLTKHPYLAKVVDKYGHIVMPAVLILLGIFILYENDSMRLLTKGW